MEEEFYRQRWPDIRFDRDKKSRKDDRDSPALTALLEWSGTDLVASQVRPEKLKGAPWGVMLMVSDARDLETGDEKKTATHTAAQTAIVVLNFRDFKDYRP